MEKKCCISTMIVMGHVDKLPLAKQPEVIKRIIIALQKRLIEVQAKLDNRI